MRKAERVARIGEKRRAHKFWWEKLKERPQVKCRCRWKINFKILWEIVDKIDLTQDMDQSPAFVNAVINVWV
jgi:hypothetical protein